MRKAEGKRILEEREGERERRKGRKDRESFESFLLL